MNPYLKAALKGSHPSQIKQATGGEFGARIPHLCGNCGVTFKEPLGIIHHAATYWDPEDGSDVCPECYSDDLRDNTETPNVMKGRRRARVEKLDIAA